MRLVHRWLPAGHREALHTHAFMELCHVESGRGLLRGPEGQAVVGAHTVTLVPAGTAHGLAADAGWSCGANVVHFEAEALDAEDAAAALRDLCRLAAAGHATISLRGASGRAAELDLAHLGSLCRRDDAEGRSVCAAALARLCVRLVRQARDARLPAPARPAPGEGQAARPQMDAVLAYIERNLARPISRQDLARQASFAPSYFSALFREATGTTIPEYINARRVVRAQELLRQPQMRVSAVCYAVGFRDLSNFNRVFKRLAGQTPREYRKVVLGDDGESEGAAGS